MSTYSPAIPVLHPEHATGPHWRRCRLALEFSPDQDNVHLAVAVRQDRKGAEVSDLFSSMPFRACLDHLFEDILRLALPEIARIGHRVQPILRSTTQCFSTTTGSPRMSFQLGDPVKIPLLFASRHVLVALHGAMREIGRREEIPPKDRHAERTPMSQRTGNLAIETLGGNCPVQGEGWIGESRFYFKARDNHWGLGIGGDPCLSPDWYYEEAAEAAGHMSEAEAMGCLHRAAHLWRQGHPGDHTHWSEHNRRAGLATMARVAAELRETDPTSFLLARLEARIAAG